MKVVFVVGATASGKSDWALRWAQKYQGVVINCDSVQVYREVEIGTAKPTLAERALCPHFLFDYVSPPQEMTAGQYARDFESCIEKLNTPVAFVVGGTGFYFQAIEKGLYPVPTVAPEVKSLLDQESQSPEGRERLWQELVAADPESAQKLHPNDIYRITRALEIWRSFKKTMAEFKAEHQQGQKGFPFPLLKVGPQWEREELRRRIELRTEKMLAAGLVQEVKALRALGLESWAPMSSVGYKEALEFLDQGLSVQELREKIVISTHQLAKRQMTWFKRDHDIRWFTGSTGFEAASKNIEEFLNQ